MFAGNMYAQGMYAQGYATISQTVMTILHGITTGISGFLRFTRRLV